MMELDGVVRPLLGLKIELVDPEDSRDICFVFCVSDIIAVMLSKLSCCRFQANYRSCSW